MSVMKRLARFFRHGAAENAPADQELQRMGQEFWHTRCQLIQQISDAEKVEKEARRRYEQAKQAENEAQMRIALVDFNVATSVLQKLLQEYDALGIDAIAVGWVPSHGDLGQRQSQTRKLLLAAVQNSAARAIDDSLCLSDTITTIEDTNRQLTLVSSKWTRSARQALDSCTSSQDRAVSQPVEWRSDHHDPIKHEEDQSENGGGAVDAEDGDQYTLVPRL